MKNLTMHLIIRIIKFLLKRLVILVLAAIIGDDSLITSVFADSGDENDSDQPIKDKGKNREVASDKADIIDLTKDEDDNNSDQPKRTKGKGKVVRFVLPETTIDLTKDEDDYNSDQPKRDKGKGRAV